MYLSYFNNRNIGSVCKKMKWGIYAFLPGYWCKTREASRANAERWSTVPILTRLSLQLFTI